MLYAQLARIGFRRNMAYVWAHLLTSVTSVIFGFIYIALWQAVAPAEGDGYTREVLTGQMVLTQVFAYLTVFLPAGLGIQNTVRTGQIALDMTRPVPYIWTVMAREVGNLWYQFIYRAGPCALMFALTVGFPLPASAGHLLLFIPSLALGAYNSLLLVYTIGMSALWTTEIRWAHWAYHALSTLLAGAWIPLEVLPDWAQHVVPYLPFASTLGYPLRIYLGMGAPSEMGIQFAWALALTMWGLWLTRKALDRLVVQGG